VTKVFFHFLSGVGRPPDPELTSLHKTTLIKLELHIITRILDARKIHTVTTSGQFRHRLKTLLFGQAYGHDLMTLWLLPIMSNSI